MKPIVYHPSPALYAQLIRPENSHKGLFGSVAVVGGHVGMVGAAILAGRAALATGAGKVCLHVMDERLVVDVFAPELMVRGALDDLGTANAIAVGMGLGQSQAAQAVLHHVLTYVDKPMVLDADALNLIAQQTELQTQLKNLKQPPVLTPHPAEAARLLGCTTDDVQADRVLAAQTIAAKYSCIVVLKGMGSVVAQPDGVCRINPTGSSALSVAGQGDMLSGMMAALLALDLPPFEAVCLAVYWHGWAGQTYETQAGGVVGLNSHDMMRLIRQVVNQALSQTLNSD